MKNTITTALLLLILSLLCWKGTSCLSKIDYQQPLTVGVDCDQEPIRVCNSPSGHCSISEFKSEYNSLKANPVPVNVIEDAIKTACLRAGKIRSREGLEHFVVRKYIVEHNLTMMEESELMELFVKKGASKWKLTTCMVLFCALFLILGYIYVYTQIPQQEDVLARKEIIKMILTLAAIFTLCITLILIEYGNLCEKTTCQEYYKSIVLYLGGAMLLYLGVCIRNLVLVFSGLSVEN